MKKLFQIGADVLGEGRILFEWSSKGNFLAVCGSKRKVNILDRNGRLYDEIHFPPSELPTGDVRAPAATALQWDPVGEQLAMLPNGNTFIYVWSAISKELQKIETEFKAQQELTALAWSRQGLLLAVGTAKGNLLLYNSRERKKTPYLGKHTKRVVSAVWDGDGLLALAGMDRTVTITDGTTGETVHQFPLKGDPEELRVASSLGKRDGPRAATDALFSVLVSRRSVCVLDASPAAATTGSGGCTELELQEAFGDVQSHLWLSIGTVLIAFRSGQLALHSYQSGAVTQAAELWSGRTLDVLSDVAHSAAQGRVAVTGGCSVRVLDASSPGSELREVKADALDLEPHQALVRAGWTHDGQVLTVCTATGQLLSFLAALPVVFDFYGNKVMHLTSLLEMSILDVSRRGAAPMTMEIEAEPAFCGLGPEHAAVGINNQIWFYKVGGSAAGRLVGRRDHTRTITAVKLSGSHAAVLSEGRVIVHPIEVVSGRPADEQDVVLPPPGQNQTLTCVALTPHFIITGSKQGVLSYYLADGAAPVNDYRHDGGAVVRLFPQPQGVRTLFEDETGGLLLFNPVNDQVLAVPGIDGRPESVAWDGSDPTVFVVAHGGAIHTFVFHATSMSGPRIECIGQQTLPATHLLLMLAAGTVGCRLRNGAVDHIQLESHRGLITGDALNRTGAVPKQKFHQCLKLGRLRAAWECAVTLKASDAWAALGSAALELLDLDLAIAAYRMLGDASMVLSLEAVLGVEEKTALAAHILVLQDRDHAQAQELFLRSSHPKAALEMRKDLKQWSEALKLAEQLDPGSLGLICKEHAASLEMTGEYASARTHYQQALDSLATRVGGGPGGVESSEAEAAARAGICRCTLQLGDLRAARTLALQLNSAPLFKECAMILEGLSQLNEAAEMYERCGQYEKAASIYIQAKNFSAATPLMAKVTSSKLHLQLAKAKEVEGRYAEAAASYEAAGDLDAVVRLCLGPLNTPQRAYALVRRTRSAESATALAKFCLKTQDFQGAVEFLLVAGQMDQAFDIAQGHNEMDVFARIVAASAKAGDYARIAQYYESRGEFLKAGDMWAAGENYPRAVQLYLRMRSDAALDKAIGVVETTRNHGLGVLVLDYVTEEKSGGARDEYRFKLNLAMGQYGEAARDAMELAKFEQEEGNYRVAHDKLFATVQQLQQLRHRVPTELMRALMLLHSYTLVKSLIAINDHTSAARMLVRIARSISKFPKHIVPILTSTIIECNRAGLKKTAFEYAAMLMQPEYRDQVAPKYKKKIELMVRKPDKDAEEVEEAQVPCAFCGHPGPETELQCFSCQNIIPFDISTGKRMQLSDWAECPSCSFPCSAAQFVRILAAERRCPMCNDEIKLDDVRRVADPLGALRRRQEEATGGGGVSSGLPGVAGGFATGKPSAPQVASHAVGRERDSATATARAVAAALGMA